MREKLEVTSFYKFFPIDQSELPVRKLSLEARAAKFDIRGLVILAKEGCNGTVCGSFESIRFFEQSLPILFGHDDWHFKRAYALEYPFDDFLVKIRPEIVTIRSEQSAVSNDNYRTQKESHLTPEEWQHVLDTDPNVVLVDVRNTYETRLGSFRGAVDPRTENFSEFPDAISRMDIPKDKKVLMYCTGGIRCEKAIGEMQRRGYENVFQLSQGILNYLEHFPHKGFEGECFVFDGRVAVDQNLNPTRTWSLCPHCGQPGKEDITCDVCGDSAVVCDICLKLPERHSCSHDCRYKSQRALLVANA